MSEDQDLPARPALSGRRERARLLGEDGPPTRDGDGADRAVPGDRPPAVPQEPLAPGLLPRRVPGSAPGGRTAPPGVRPAEPIRLPRPAGDVPSRGAFEPPPKSGEAAGPPDGGPAPARPSGSARLPDLKPASDSWSGAFQPTGGPDGRTGGRPGGRPAGTVLADDLQPGVHPAAPSSPSRMTSPAAPPVPGPPAPSPSVPGSARQADSTSLAGQAPAPSRAVSGDRTSAPAPSRFGQSPDGGLRTDGPAGLTPARRPSAADSALIPASRRPAADSTLTPASRRSLAESALGSPPSPRAPVSAAPPGAGSETESAGPQTRSAGARPGAAGARPPARSPKAEPSWGSVLASTMRLWAQRRGRRWRATVVAALVLVVAAAGVTAGTVWMTSRHRAVASPSSSTSPTAAHSPPAVTGAVSAAASVRKAAARWVTNQVDRAAIVACDPAMCSLLHDSGFPAANLVPVLPDTTDPLGADLVMATAVVRNQFGRHLTQVYAPLAIARFGTGNLRIDVRQVLPAGSSGARAQLAAKLREARQSGRQLLANSRIQVSGQARTVLSNGHVDERLMATLAALATEEPIDVLGFGDANPGASAWVPLRSVDLVATDPDQRRNARAYRHALISFLRAQDAALYRATSITVLTTQSGSRVIRIAFAAPSP